MDNDSSGYKLIKAKVLVGENVSEIIFDNNKESSLAEFFSIAIELGAKRIFFEESSWIQEDYLISLEDFRSHFRFTEQDMDSELYTKLSNRLNEYNKQIEQINDGELTATSYVFFASNQCYKINIDSATIEQFELEDFLENLQEEFEDEIDLHRENKRNDYREEIETEKINLKKQKINAYMKETKILENLLSKDELFKLCRTKGARQARIYDISYENELSEILGLSQEKLESIAEYLQTKIYGIR